MSPRHARPEPEEPRDRPATPPEPSTPAPAAPGAASASAPPEAATARAGRPPAASSAPSAPPPGGRTPRVRSRWMWGALAVIGAVLIGWLAVSMLDGAGPADPQPSPTASAFAEQETLLIQVRNDSDFGADNLVAGVGGQLPVAQLLVPSRLIVDVPGAGQQTLGHSARLLDRSASQDALGDLLALRIDGTLSLARLALAGMVDFVGGITITVDEEIVQTDEETGEEVVLVPEGTVHLDGTQAAAYALAWLPEEPEAARMARYSTVMTATISALPDDQLRVEQMLTSLGGSARTTTTTSQVAAFLIEMRRGILAGGQQVRVLPTSEIESGGTLQVVRVDLAAADAMLQTLLPQAVLTGAQSSPRVLVQNGVGTPGLGAGARDKLVGAGMVYINGGNAEQFGQELTAVVVADESAEALALGEDVAEALGVPATAVQVAGSGQNVADAVVVLGADFEP